MVDLIVALRKLSTYRKKRDFEKTDEPSGDVKVAPSRQRRFVILGIVIFAVVVTMIHCYYGYYASGGPAGVGVASGRAIRTSIVTVVIINLFLSIIFWGGGDTVRIAG